MKRIVLDANIQAGVIGAHTLPGGGRNPLECVTVGMGRKRVLLYARNQITAEEITMSVGPMFARRVSCLFALVICTALPGGRSAQAQFVSSANKPSKTSGKRVDKAPPSTQVSVGLFGQFTPTRSPNTYYSTIGPSGTYITNFDTRQTTSSSAGIEATFHQQFSRYIGYNIDLGYSRFAEKYGTVDRGSTVIYGIIPTNDSQSFGTNMYEVGASAVVEGPRTRRLSTSAETGVSVLTFLPTVRPSDLHLQFRPALAFGLGVNY